MTRRYLTLLAFLLLTLLGRGLEAAKYVVLVTSGNNEAWIKKHITSVFEQDFDDFRVVWVDDASTDKTSTMLQEEIAKHPKGDLVTYIRNDFKSYQTSCTYQAIHEYIDDDEVIIFLDGDDWFIHDSVISRVDRFYTENPETWLATSRLQKTPSGIVTPRGNPVSTLTFRDKADPKKTHSVTFLKCTALRTCRAWLFKLIDKEYLMMDGKFTETGGDVGYLYPMFCMAGNHYGFIDEILYLYNMHHQNDSFAKRKETETTIRKFILRQPYRPLGHSPERSCSDLGCRVCKKYYQ